MKSFIVCALSIYVTLAVSSCTKSSNPPDNNTNKTDTTANTPKCSDTSDVLTRQTWLYCEYFTNFSDPATVLTWKTGRTSNTVNMTKNRVKYNCDNSYWETDENGDTLKGTWSYLNNGTQVQVVNKKGTFVSTAQVLTAKRYEWLGPSSTYGVMLPVNLTVDSAAGHLALLTANPWVYTEYFNNYNVTAPSLVWKTNKANSSLNLSKNVVTFNTNGTYTEIDETGATYNGTWTFLNNQTQVQTSSVKGTFTSTIKLLTTERYEWVNTDGVTYGEMVHK